MTTDETPDTTDEVGSLADLTAHEASAFLTAVTEVASGNSPDTAIPLLTLALSQILGAGSRLGAIQDVVLEERYEADPGPDEDPDPLRDGLANLRVTDAISAAAGTGALVELPER